MLHATQSTICLIWLTALACAFDEVPKPGSPPAFRPVSRPAVPVVKGAGITPIDSFILASLKSRQLGLNPEADRSTLIRRVSFDLTGLPPTLSEIEAFRADKSPGAYNAMINRYLDSPQYGVRMGKLWLDAVGYADSNGYFNADTDRPLAWKYRDYVVKSLNGDKPYDQFVREQIAGDELAAFTPGGDITPAMVDALTATHFLRNAPDGTGESDGNPDEVRTDRFTVLEGNIQNMVNSLLGLTIQCARCHDHKFEPITQAEYYSLQALLFPVYNPDKWLKPNDRVVTAGTRQEREAWQRRTELVDKQVKAAQAGLAGFAEPLREQLLDERLQGLDSPTRISVMDAVKTPKEKRTTAQHGLLKNHAKLVEIDDEALIKRFPEYGALRLLVQKTVAEREKERPKPQEKLSAFVETDASPPVHHLLKRGVHSKPGEEVQPGALAALTAPNRPFVVDPRPAGRVSTGRRTAFARWVATAENPLFARVMVNRIWQHHFGIGLVATADNLGLSGAKPSHPELLDFLASEFIQGGWSIKKLHRQIMLSAVYRQSSAPRDGLDAIDPDNRLLARFPLRRLDAEAIRDAMLHVSGDLDTRTGGPYVPSKRTAEGIVEVSDGADGARKRSIYLQQRRTQVVTFLQLFDAPAMVSTCGKRTLSTVPLQSLTLLNSEFARARAKSMAARLAREAGADSTKRLTHGFQLACGREPDKAEQALCEQFMAGQRKVFAGLNNAEDRVWADLCQMLMASNAFLYVE